MPVKMSAEAAANCGGFSRSSLQTVLLMRLKESPAPPRMESCPSPAGSQAKPSRGAKLSPSARKRRSTVAMRAARICSWRVAPGPSTIPLKSPSDLRGVPKLS
jgi:hypothetical protein